MDFVFPLLGEGMVDWKGNLEALRSISHNGFLSVDFQSSRYCLKIPNNDPLKIAQISMEQLKQLVKLA